jgi:hypothetical protein
MNFRARFKNLSLAAARFLKIIFKISLVEQQDF